MIEEIIKKEIKVALEKLGKEILEVNLEYPRDMNNGDYSTNVAMVLGNENPKEFAEKMVAVLKKSKQEKFKKYVKDIKVAGNGFINFFLSDDFFLSSVKAVLKENKDYGKNQTELGKKVMVEYTDPNVMKPFHIGHLMNNAIGETVARLFENSGADVKRANYFSDTGLGIAEAVWGVKTLEDKTPGPMATLSAKVGFLGKAYVYGVKMYKEDEGVKKEINDINKEIVEKRNGEIFKIYKKARSWSLKKFKQLYKLLDSKFDFFYPESEVSDSGKELVKESIKNAIFRESNGAVVFDGSHTRVFITNKGLATYEAKELGLNKKKYEDYKFDNSIIITANEQDGYFDVVLEAMGKVLPEIAKKTKHISHGIMKFSDRKMSSRLGNVITAEDLIEKIKTSVKSKMKTHKRNSVANFFTKGEDVSEKVAIGAIKYSILKQAIGRDIIFDMDKDLSFEGVSGPYLQYTYVRATSIVKKAGGIDHEISHRNIGSMERLIHRFPSILERASKEFAPQLLVSYLTELASSFNSFYARERIIDKSDKNSNYKIALTKAVSVILKNGMKVLAIPIPKRM